MTSIYNWIFEQKLDLNKKILSTQSVDYTYQDILMDIERYTTLLKPLGDIKNKKVALIVPTVHTFIALALTVSKLGGIIVPLSPLLRQDDLLKVLDFSDPHIVFTNKIHNGFNLNENVHSWAVCSKKETMIFVSDNNVQWEQTTLQGDKRPLELENIQIIGCTSGSTGTPKGIVADFNYISTANQGFRVVSDISFDDSIFLMAPASGLLGLCWLLSSIHSGYHIMLTESFSFPDIIKLLEEKPCQKLISTPSLVRALNLFCKASGSTVLDQLSLVTLAGEPITEDFVHSIANFKGKMNSFYGFSELGGMMYTENDVREGLNWSLLPNIQYKIKKQSTESVGEIYFKNENDFLGYYKRPDLTEEVYSGGWYHSGDLAMLNQDGKIEIMGRQKDMIKKGGQQVIPAEIERFFGDHPSIQKAVVVGIPHPVFGEQIVAFLVKDNDIDCKDLYEYCNEKIARYKVPDQIHFIEEFPINQGKVDKVTLKQLAIRKK